MKVCNQETTQDTSRWGSFPGCGIFIRDRIANKGLHLSGKLKSVKAVASRQMALPKSSAADWYRNRLAERLGKQGSKYAVEQFSFEKIVEKEIAILAEISAQGTKADIEEEARLVEPP